jgi:ribonuclease III
LTSNRSAHPAPPAAIRVPGSRSADPKRAALLEKLERQLDYRFRNRDLLDLALTHSSVAYEEQLEHHPQEDNEQLEFLGDAVLGLVVTEHLFRTYPEFAEGPLTRLRAQFVSRQHLGRVGQTLGLGEYLRLGKGEEKSGGRKKSAILANTVEAVIAAVYLDGGLEHAARLVRTLLLDEKMETLVAAARSGEGVGDHKSTLQEYSQAHGLGQPIYQVTSEAGPDHRKSFVVAVKLVQLQGAELTLASATGTRKKNAEQEAARLALESLHASENSVKPADSEKSSGENPR